MEQALKPILGAASPMLRSAGQVINRDEKRSNNNILEEF
jgi:hypothetical protein